jgi:phosphoserine phosphatase
MVVVFDFDKTLTYKDTLLGFFSACSRKDPTRVFKHLLYIILMVAHKLKIISNTNLKRMGVGLFLRGKSKEFIIKCAEHYSGKIKLNRVVYETEFKKYKNPYVISASFIEYLRPLFPGATLICSEIEFDKNGVKSLKKNCYGEVKIHALKSIGIDKIDILYTDGAGDLFLAKMSKQINLVKGERIIKCNDVAHFMKLAA